MPLEKILQALREQTADQIEQIEQAAQAEVERINAEAQAEAAVARQRHLPAIQAPLHAEQARIFNQAKLEALRVVLGTREALIESVLEAAAFRLHAVPGSEPYARVMAALIQETFAALGADSRLCLRVRSEDVALLQQLVQEMGLPTGVEGGLENQASSGDPIGGLVGTTADGRISLVDTLAERLRRVGTRYRSQIVDMLLDSAQEG